MIVRFHALSSWPNPELYIWRPTVSPAKPGAVYNLPILEQDARDFKVFTAELDHQIHEYVHFKLHSGAEWEDDSHNRYLPRLNEYRFPPEVWLVQGTRRVLLEDPFAASQMEVLIHLVTKNKYRGGKLYLWRPGSTELYLESEGDDENGIYFHVKGLAGTDQHFFAFKFVDAHGGFEPEYANRLWCAHDGKEVWVHSQADHVSSEKPVRKTLTVHLPSQPPSFSPPGMHLWQAQSDFASDIEGTLTQSGDYTFACEKMLYTGMPYGFMFFEPSDSPEARSWEHEEARREITLADDQTVWTLTGDHELFDEPPVADREIILEVVNRPPSARLVEPLELDVWVNRAAEGSLHQGLKPREDGSWVFRTYPEVVTSLRFRSGSTPEAVERHTIKIPRSAVGPTPLFVILDRMDLLPEKPVADLFQDPPFLIERPGVWERDGNLRFAIHVPRASWVQIIGQWTGWRTGPIPMRSTMDGTYWWAQLPVADILQGANRTDYHGVFYKFLINGILERQDPAADWVENSGPESASRLVNHARYAWEAKTWQTPGWESLILYQIHPKRFSQRFAAQELSPFRQVAKEITDNAGYLRQLGTTALQLMPVSEFAGDNSWGYGPAFFFAVESAYGGPDDLKYLVDTCHQHGIAVLLDVVYNHAGTSDNILWAIAPESYFDGDTKWGAMINFDHPQAMHFFEENLRYLRREYRVDGFRLDHTYTIVHSQELGYFVTKPGSGGGWEFLHKLRAALRDLDPLPLLVAEHLPNEWAVTNYGGPMDSQWNDAFHDRLVDACRGWEVMPPLADALKLGQTDCDNWYKVTNYPESHDEVGNVNDRIVNVAGFGQGLRRNKVAAVTTLVSRGIPMWFMGAESGEWGQFTFSGQDALDLERYLLDDNCRRLCAWWNVLLELRRGNPKLQGPSPLQIHYAVGNLLAFSRGEGEEYFVVANFGPWWGWISLAELNLPDWPYRELWNSTWPAFAVEGEDEHGNGGRDAQIWRHQWLQIPDYGAVILERIP